MDQPDEPGRPNGARGSDKLSQAGPRRRSSPLQRIVTVLGCVLGGVLMLSGLLVVGVMVLLWTGSIQLFPNK
ncbi:hypothetical protein OIB37_06075 [Streptomyces sp. NBC_00820]|uniref:hypothetical protein n=1 Tax=Streptomyces sp. NBC_00820 TaxID=2975842 RepID=UPI002ECFE73B|nr:hypothetical protein OIB37_06075 [Streptomyces sp. NBC_00820]